MIPPDEVEAIIVEYYRHENPQDAEAYEMAEDILALRKKVEDMTSQLERLRQENTRLGWIESPDRMGS